MKWLQMEARDIAAESTSVCNLDWAWDLSDRAMGIYTRAKRWLVVKEDGYYCTVCSRAAGGHKRGRGVWAATPCTNKNMKEAIRKHENNALHKTLIDEQNPDIQPSMPQKLVEQQPQSVLFV